MFPDFYSFFPPHTPSNGPKDGSEKRRAANRRAVVPCELRPPPPHWDASASSFFPSVAATRVTAGQTWNKVCKKKEEEQRKSQKRLVDTDFHCVPSGESEEAFKCGSNQGVTSGERRNLPRPPPGIVPDLSLRFVAQTGTGVSQPESESTPGYPADTCTDGLSVASHQNRWCISSTLGARLCFCLSFCLLKSNCARGVADGHVRQTRKQAICWVGAGLTLKNCK